MGTVINTDVLIVGSGPIGATYARLLLENNDETNFSVTMVEMGAQETEVPGENKKNAAQYQLDLDRFVNVVKGDLATVSIPPDTAGHFSTLHPESFRPPHAVPGTSTVPKPYIQNGRNPAQNPHVNLGEAAVTRCVGGMSSHWTCAIPEQHPQLERYPLYPNDETADNTEWARLYKHSKYLINYSPDGEAFEKFSVRQRLVRHTLETAYPTREFLPLPQGVERRTTNDRFVTWSSAATVFGEYRKDTRFKLLPNYLCRKLVLDPLDPTRVQGADVEDLGTRKKILIVARRAYVVCAGAVLTPQLLYNSGIRPAALGCYLMEQTLAFCQVVLRQDLVDKVREIGETGVDTIGLRPELVTKIKNHIIETPKDPLPFPSFDPDPQVMWPVREDYPWHGQIHRDAFAYGAVSEFMDSRIVVDLRWFGMVEPNIKNKVTFEEDYQDLFQMPQPTFQFSLGDEDRKKAGRMMNDMITVAHTIGGFVPGSEAQFMAPGAALHITGTTRVGERDTDSVVNNKGKVHNLGNVWLGGCGLIRKENACNPTLTAMCYAIRGVEDILGVPVQPPPIIVTT